LYIWQGRKWAETRTCRYCLFYIKDDMQADGQGFCLLAFGKKDFLFCSLGFLFSVFFLFPLFSFFFIFFSPRSVFFLLSLFTPLLFFSFSLSFFPSFFFLPQSPLFFPFYYSSPLGQHRQRIYSLYTALIRKDSMH